MKKLVVYIFLFVLFCFGPFSELLAQTLVVRGRVVDGQTGEILSDANVFDYTSGKDFLIYGGFYELLSANGYLAVLEIMVVSLLLTFLFGTAFWADIIKKLSRVSVRKLYS